MTADTKRLLATTDASIWAEEWCKIAHEINEADDDREVIDEGWMISWFANAIMVGYDAGFKKGYDEGLEEGYDEGYDVGYGHGSDG